MTVKASQLLDHLRCLFTSAALGSLADSALLARFVYQRDHYAFAALVARYGPMVHNVCYRLLGNAHTAEAPSWPRYSEKVRGGTERGSGNVACIGNPFPCFSPCESQSA